MTQLTGNVGGWVGRIRFATVTVMLLVAVEVVTRAVASGILTAWAFSVSPHSEQAAIVFTPLELYELIFLMYLWEPVPFIAILIYNVSVKAAVMVLPGYLAGAAVVLGLDYVLGGRLLDPYRRLLASARATWGDGDV